MLHIGRRTALTAFGLKSTSADDDSRKSWMGAGGSLYLFGGSGNESIRHSICIIMVVECDPCISWTVKLEALTVAPETLVKGSPETPNHVQQYDFLILTLR
jgi:hypothetical protein